MSPAAPAQVESEAEMVKAMSGCAYELGLAAAEIAEGCKGDPERFIQASAEFRQCFFALRMGIRLRLKLREPIAAAAAERPQAEGGLAEREAPERAERPDGDGGAPERERDRDREGDYEPVSLPQFLNSLGVVVNAAERRGCELPEPLAAETLPRLRSLLAAATPAAPADPPAADPAGRGSGVAVLARPPAAPSAGARARLLGSAAAPPRGPPAFRSG
jgi:hypothetical protein